MGVRGFGVELVSAVGAVILVLGVVRVLWVSALGSYGSSRRRQAVFEVEEWG